jgi:membrane-associated HD superfamily phosphohydrolase
MNTEAIKTFGEFIAKNLREGKDFSLEQAPDIIQQFIFLRISENIFAIITSIVLIIVSLLMFRLVHNKCVADKCELILIDDPLYMILTLLGGAISIVSIVNIIHSCYSLMYIYVAPKIFLLEYCDSLR